LHVALLTQNSDLAFDARPCAEACALAGAGYDVTLVGATAHRDELRESVDRAVQTELYRPPRNGSSFAGLAYEMGQSFAGSALALARLARKHPIDVLHASNPPDDSWLLLPIVRAVQRGRLRFVFDQHDVAPFLVASKDVGGFARRAAEHATAWLERNSFEAASLVVFANEEYAMRARTDGLLRGPGIVVPNGWTLPAGPPDSAWRDGARHLIAYVGTISEQDNVDHLVDAIAELAVRDDVRVVVGGDGSALPSVKLRARERGVARSFTWLGWMSDRAEIASLVRSADVCVAPEVDTDFNRISTFVKIVEYMSAGAATVAHRLPATERLCGDAARYPADMSAGGLARTIEALLNDKLAAERLGAVARDRFNTSIRWEAVGRPRLVEGYRRVFGASDSR
jgi:glycosyltransferase involved in cell wall biosynthesis